MTNRLGAVTILGIALMTAQIGLAGDRAQEKMTKIEKQVRRELVTLPYYNLFDTLSFSLYSGTVTLTGQVTRPLLKSDAENVVKNIEGVTSVNNQIKVLPLSPNDNGLRLSLYRAIYGQAVLETLAVRAVPPIHIIVDNGQVTLEGAVANAMQKTVAGMQANSVPGVFSVTNNLLVDDAS